mmetsp:Transcript_31501/g.60886  ORF Transcript_31501/g.60886 Transcript_31501/m.60886 type:complete len:1195 (-) Transcript_31501:458-4042(-)
MTKLQRCAHQLRGFLHVGQHSSGSCYVQTQRRYFAMVVKHEDGNQGLGYNCRQYEFGQWKTQEAFQAGLAATTSVTAQSITDVVHGRGGVAEASIQIRYRESENLKEMLLVAKEARGLLSNHEARRWFESFQHFLVAMHEESNDAHSGRSKTANIHQGSGGGAKPATVETGQSELLALATSRTLENDQQVHNMEALQTVPRASSADPPPYSPRPLVRPPARRRRGTLQAPRGSQAHVRVFARSSTQRRSTGIPRQAAMLGRSSTFSMKTGSSDEEGYESDPGLGSMPQLFTMSSHHCLDGLASPQSPSNSMADETSPRALVSELSQLSAAEQLYEDEWGEDACMRASENLKRSETDLEYCREESNLSDLWLMDLKPPDVGAATPTVRTLVPVAHATDPARGSVSETEDAHEASGLSSLAIADNVLPLADEEGCRSEDVAVESAEQVGKLLTAGMQMQSTQESEAGADSNTQARPNKVPEDGKTVGCMSMQQRRQQKQQPLLFELDDGDEPQELLCAELFEEGREQAQLLQQPGGERQQEKRLEQKVHEEKGVQAGTVDSGCQFVSTPSIKKGKGALLQEQEPHQTGEEREQEQHVEQKVHEETGGNVGATDSGSQLVSAPSIKGKGKTTLPQTKGNVKGGPAIKGAPPLASGKGKGQAKGTGQSVQPKKAVVKPIRPMKSLWWTRLLFGQNLEIGSSVWDKVGDVTALLPLDVFEDKFAKIMMQQKNNKKTFGAGSGSKKPATTMKELRIITDTNLIVGKEGALRDFPPPDVVAQALRDLDSAVLTPQRLAVLRAHFCPQPAEVARLEECKRNHPDLPFGPPERYMWYVSRVPAFSARVECWSFLCAFNERAAGLSHALVEFQRLVDAFKTSEALPHLLSLVLAVGNYLNGGTSRGQADGFDLEALGKLDGVKDNGAEGGMRDMRHFIFELFFLGAPQETLADLEGATEASFACGEQLLDDFAPLFLNVNRTIVKDSEGVRVIKNVRVILEDIEDSVREFTQQFAMQQEALLQCLQHSEDPADPMRLHMSEKFAEARPQLARLESQCSSCRDGYTSVLSYFSHPGMKTSDFVLLWDNLFVPGDLIMSKPDSLLRREILPCFCKPQVVPTLQSFLVLWDLKLPNERVGSPASVAQLVARARKADRARRQPRGAARIAPASTKCWRGRVLAKRDSHQEERCNQLDSETGEIRGDDK